jgi:hypothetical protein
MMSVRIGYVPLSFDGPSGPPAPTIQLTGNTVAENASVGTTVGTLSVANPGTGSPVYTLTDSAGGKFSITGALLKVAGALDYETAIFHSVTVHVTGMTPNPADRPFIILVTDVDDTAPTITSSAAISNAENSVLAHALTANETVTWAIVAGGADNARFEISGSTLRWLSNGVKDFETPNDANTDNAYIVTVRATDAALNVSTTQTITVTVTDVADTGGGTTTVTAPNGQTWTFAGTLTNGTYINGDPWVLDTGAGVSLTAVSTMPTGTGAEARNGGMINPTFNTMVEVKPFGQTNSVSMKQGYDGRCDETHLGVDPTFDYDVAYNAHATLPKTLHAGDSLVSAVSKDAAQTFAAFWAVPGSNKKTLDRMAVVTVVGTTPAVDAFRPNYFGTTKYNFTWSGVNTALLPNLTAPYNPKSTAFDGFHIDAGSVYAAGSPDEGRTQTEMMHIASLRDVWYWIYPNGTSNRMMVQAHYNQQWHSYVGQVLGQLAMYCMCNFSDRDFFLKRILQVAIDAYAVAEAEGNRYQTPWWGGAGYYPSPCWSVRLAGLLFNHTGMKNAVSIPTTHVDFSGNTINKWGEINRVYLTPNTTAHAQYARVPGENYSAGFPLFGDVPLQDVSAGQSSNGTMKDPLGVFDMNDYKYCTPHASYMSAVPYTLWAPSSGPNAGIEQTGPISTTASDPPFNAEPFLGVYLGGQLGNYMSSNNPSMMATVLSSIAMGDAAFWSNPAVVPFAKRARYDKKMWLGWGYEFDSSDVDTLKADVRGHGGTGNGWMIQMWDLINPVPNIETITPSSLPITGQTITPTYSGAGAGPTTVFNVTLAGGPDAGWGGYNLRQIIGASNLAAATGQYIRLTLGLKLVGDAMTIVAYVGQGSTGGNAYSTTAMRQLTGGSFGSGTYTQVGTTADVVLVSDWFLLNETYDETKDLVISLFGTGSGLSFYSVADAANSTHYKAPPNEAATAVVGTYSFNAAATQIISKIEIQP